ncbi:hypothetical protein [Shinella sp.]|uniref:hypothetical protein n=1 Tax=Shinella sp. TaxID=1870904 RepID=UPI0028AA2410|nr:hypothetical protein [Shinella sp.]
MPIYHKVSRHHVSAKTDLVITLIDGIAGPCAFITDPVQARDTIPLPVEDALASARQMVASDIHRRKLVIVDEDDLWHTRWGDLVLHPDHSP